MPYLHEIRAALAAADRVVSRAGASSIGEYPLAARGAHSVSIRRYQKVNADYLAERNAAVILPDELLRTVLSTVIKDLLSMGTNRDAMKTAMKKPAQPHAAEDIAGQLVNWQEHKPYDECCLHFDVRFSLCSVGAMRGGQKN